MKKYLAIITAVIGAIVAILLSQRKSDRDMVKLKKFSREADKRVEKWKAITKASEVKANESIKDHRDNFGNNIDDTLEFIERGKKPNP